MNYYLSKKKSWLAQVVYSCSVLCSIASRCFGRVFSFHQRKLLEFRSKNLINFCGPEVRVFLLKFLVGSMGEKKNLLRGKSFWGIKVPQNSTWGWKKLLKLRD
jgi:hypothetical protein